MNTVKEMELALLNAQCDEELLNTLYLTRTHGTPSCYMAGCRGPMCRAANTNMNRERRNISYTPTYIDLEISRRVGVHQAARAEKLAHHRRGAAS